MIDRGHYRNSVYAVKVTDLPNGIKRTQDKHPKDWNSTGESLNKCFYRFGSKSNIRSSL